MAVHDIGGRREQWDSARLTGLFEPRRLLRQGHADDWTDSLTGLNSQVTRMAEMDQAFRRQHPGLVLVGMAIMLAWPLLTAPGCAVAGVVADRVAGGERRVKVEADYRDLEDRSVAVLVAADGAMLYHSPQARERVIRQTSAGVAEHVSGTTLANPRQIVEFQNTNPYWATVPAGRLLEVLDVERLVLIDLVEYRTHDPGNRHIWRGRITGNVAVHAADVSDPDNPDYYGTVTVNYPEDDQIGVVDPDTDTQTIELAMVKVFARDVVRLFHDHEVRR